MNRTERSRQKKGEKKASKDVEPVDPTSEQTKMVEDVIALHQSGQLDLAEIQYKKLLNYLPDSTLLLTNLGTIALQKGRLEDGVRTIGKSLQINSNQPNALNNRGYALKNLKRLDEALVSFDHAIALKPDYVEAYSNRGNALKDLNRLDEALASYDRAIALTPDHADAYWNKSLLKILIGEYLEGWKLYEWRWKKEPQINSLRAYHQPLWLGDESIIHKTLLIYPEQGFGDYIQFIRYAALVEQIGAKVILEVPSELMTLCSTLKGQFTLIEKGKPLPNFDYYCPVMSLPLALKTTVESIPAQIPYLYADDEKQKQWYKKLGAKTLTRIGLVWSGSAIQKKDRNRSMLLNQLTSLFELPVEIHSLQKEIRKIDIKTLTDFPKIHQHQDDLQDFSDTAALIEAMDVVISVCTSVAHLSGAMGKKTFILLSYSPSERWMLDRTDSPWYPTATLFRQPAMGDWDSVISEIRQLLSD